MAEPSRRRDERAGDALRRDLAVRACVGRARGLFDVYVAEARLEIAQQFQYRVANYLYMIGMVAEPVIYLVVWSTVAEQQGGSVGGFTPGAFAAYYIVWTLVRNMNIVFTPYGWEERIREGRALRRSCCGPLFPIVRGPRLVHRLEVRGHRHVAADRGRAGPPLPPDAQPVTARRSPSSPSRSGAPT